MPFNELVYDAAVQLARPLLQLAAPVSPKVRAGLEGRREAHERLIGWAKAHRDFERPLVWLHAPSVGESLMAQAIIAQVRALRENAQVAFTYFSPSAQRTAPQVGADVFDYLPWDTRGNARQLIAHLRPGVIAFVRTELWPALVREASLQHTPTALVNAVLGPRSSRLKPAARWLLGDAYTRLSAVGAVSHDHATRFLRLGVKQSRLSVTGDARFDQVAQRVANLDLQQPLLQRLRDDKVTTLVCGSTWPSDEAEILKPLAQARKGCPLRIIIAPHEPDAPHLRALEARLDAAGLGHTRLSAIENNDHKLPEVIVVDRTGVLADLYAIGQVAYVGGGFHDAGLHSVVEPAALGVPVVFGPRHGNAREADELAGMGGGFVASDGAGVASIVLDLANRKLHRQKASDAARTFVQGRLGAGKRNAELIIALLKN